MTMRGAQLTFSETATWRRVKALVQKIVRENNVLGPKQEAAVYELDGIADDMLAQLADGVHRNPRHQRNPVLTVYNPVMKDVHNVVGNLEEMRYWYRGVGYKHTFKKEADFPTILGITGPKPMQRRDLLIVSSDNKPLWGTQAEVDRGELQ